MSSPRFVPDGIVTYLALVPYLRSQQERAVPLAELAERFDATEKAMRRMVVAIAANGTDPMEMMTFFDIDWAALEERDEVRVTNFVAFQDPPPLGRQERASLIAGLRLLASTEDVEDEAAIDALIRRLGGAAPIYATPDETLRGEGALIAQALDERRRLRFVYRAAGGADAVRTVDPVRLDALDDEPYLIAWCLDRRDRRVFRLDRMREVALLDEQAEPHPEAAEGGIYRHGEDDEAVSIRVAPSALPQAIEFLPADAAAPDPEQPGPHVLAVRMARLERLARLAAEHAGRIEVLEPAQARAAAAEWARRGLDGYAAAGIAP